MFVMNVLYEKGECRKAQLRVPPFAVQTEGRRRKLPDALMKMWHAKADKVWRILDACHKIRPFSGICHYLEIFMPHQRKKP